MNIKIPELGESITEGTISSWMKKEGDTVKFGDLLLELETDKVNLEITATSDGVLKKINKQAGETVEVGESVGTIKDTTDGETDDEPDDETDDQTDDDSDEKQSSPKQAKETEDHRSTSKDDHNERDFNASPSVRKLARERGIDLNRLTSSDPKARITRADIEAHSSEESEIQSKEKQDSAPATDKQTYKSTEPDQETAASERPVKRRRMSRRRMTIAKHLVEAQRDAAMLTTFNEVDMSAILNIRKRRKQAFIEKHDVGLGFMSFFTKAVVGALKAFPMLNAEIDGDEIIEKQFYDIGIAVSAEEGLVVPVVRGVDQLSFAKIEKRIGELAERAKSNKLKLSDLQGGTFTITNGGVFGSLLSTPILNAPQVGILGMHTIQRRPVAVDEDKIENRPMMYIALSYDHRIVDGSEAVRFLVTVKELLEDPESLLLEG
jgi:2-oxoglutarate dehydrogenase E2 component (dihydrolipoamide succinyltransferase)